VKRTFLPLAILAAALLVTACPMPDDFAFDSDQLTSSISSFDIGGNTEDDTLTLEAFPVEMTVWLDTDGGAQGAEYENLQSALDWLKDNADGGNYTVHVGRNQTITPQPLKYGTPISITLVSTDGSEKQIGLSKTGSLFTIGAGVTLTLERGITLKGLSNNLVPLVSVEKNGMLVMKDGSAIRDNSNIRNYLFESNGAGVSVAGKFVMDGGSILNNRVPGLCTGGGVILINSGEFTMNGGLISGNYAESKGGGVGSYHSLSEERAVFLMTGGTISNNTSGSGGGVYVSNYTSFTMTGGAISNNKAYSGGGVEVGGYAYGSSGELTMTGGVISNNLAELTGGGIFSQYAHKGKIVIGGNAVISGNEANTANPFRGNSAGGGIYTSSIILEGNCVIEGNRARAGAGVYLTYHESIKTVTFTMTGGVIRSNTAIEYGGGVAFNYLSQGQARDYAVPFAFDKTGGTIYGYDGGANANIVLDAVKDALPPRPGEDGDDQGEDDNNQGGISIVPYGNDQGGNNNNQGNGNGNSQGGNDNNQGNGNSQGGNNNNQGNGNGNSQGGNNNNQGNGNSQGGNNNNQGNGNSQGGNNNNQGNDNDQGEDGDDQGSNNNGGTVTDRGHAVFVFDLYWGKSYNGSDDVVSAYVHKEVTSPPADMLGAWDSRQALGAWN
jgi:hypothetical protein